MARRGFRNPRFPAEEGDGSHLAEELLGVGADLREGSGLDQSLDSLPIPSVSLQTHNECPLFLVGPPPDRFIRVPRGWRSGYGVWVGFQFIQSICVGFRPLDADDGLWLVV